MSRLVLILVVFFQICANAQTDIHLTTFVKKDTIQLRWLPYDVDVFIEGLNNGFSISKTDLSNQTTEFIDISPFNETKKKFENSTDQFILDMIEYIEDFKISKDDQFKSFAFSLLSLSSGPNRIISELCGLYFEDLRSMSDNVQYQIEVSKTGHKSNAVSLQTSLLSKNANMTELIGESRIDLKEVYLKWEAKQLNMDYSAYYIYKSIDNKKFDLLNDVPVYYFTSEFEKEKTIVDFVDTNVTEGKTYYYKVLPINHFSDQGIESNTVEVYIQKRLSGYCVIDTVENIEFERKILGYYVGEDVSDVAEYILYKGEKVDSVFIPIDELRSNGTDFEFNLVSELRTGDRQFFKVAAVSVDGDTAYSFPYYHFSLDQEPPGVPVNLNGKVDSLGLVKLNWDEPKDNDLIGYKVYRSNSLDEEFVEITTRLSKQPVFSDTLNLNTLTTEIYYKVGAIDANYNCGELTEPILLLKPDTIPPVPGVLTKYSVSEEGVLLKWHNSPSVDLVSQVLFRTSTNQLDTIMIFETEYDSMIDITGELGSSYEYYLMAKDKSGNINFSKGMKVVYEIGYRPAPILEDLIVNREDKSISLKWEQVEGDVFSIQIYRAKGESKFKLLKTKWENINTFEDKSLMINNEYHYKIKVTYKSGLSSKMSEKKSVMY